MEEFYELFEILINDGKREISSLIKINHPNIPPLFCLDLYLAK